MQMSVESLMNGEHPYYRIGHIKIFLDGKEVSHAFNLDTLGDLHHPTGYVDRYKLDGNGNAIVEGDHLMTERVYGNVEIKVV